VKKGACAVALAKDDSAGGRLPKGGDVGGRVEIVRERREIDGGDARGVVVEEGACASLAGEVRECFEVFAKKKGGGTVTSVVVRGGDAAAGGALGGDELGYDLGRKRGLVAEGDERAVEGAGKLAERGHTGSNRGGHPLGPGGAVGDQHGHAGEQGADFFGVGTEDHHDRPGRRGEGGFDGTHDEWLAVHEEELLRRAHTRRGAGGEDHGAEAERRGV